jgi:hypothetical protein
MRKHRSFRPTLLSSLEGRVVPSHAGIAAALVHHFQGLSAPLPVHTLELNGTVSGSFVTTVNSPTNVIAGTTTTFQGSGTITGLGQVSVTGTLVRLRDPSGQISTVANFTFATAKGSVTILLVNPSPTASTSTTLRSSFSIVKATGAFQGDVGTGTASLRTLTELINVVPPTVDRGVFTLTLTANPPIL